ncbi:MAG: thiamine phosphate synthase [Desulfuromonadales bacterium]|nr:thiamine phosphate synthase [Desulfuromonadales bacterium]
MASENKLDFKLYLVTDRKQTLTGTLTEVIEKALKAGVKAVQLREKDLNGRELFQLAYEIRQLTKEYGAKLFINERADIALAVNADGVQLGENSIPVHEVRKIIGDKKLIGVSCHGEESALNAEKTGANFIVFGPVYDTPSKAPFGHPLGIEKLNSVAKRIVVPIIAIGGIKKNNIQEIVKNGASGVAMISAIISAPDPYEEASEILRHL